MQPNDSTTPKNVGSSQTSIKAFGVEFSGPSWVALAFIFAVIVGGIVYLTERDGAVEAAEQSDIASSPADKATTENSADQAAAASDVSEDAKPPNGAADQPPAAEGGDDAK
jgi:hypothetical protein